MSGRDEHITGEEQETFSIFARFRRNRLALLRRVSLADALKLVVKLRAERFHDPDGVFIVSDRSGNVVDERPPEAPARPDGSGLVVVERTAASSPAPDRFDDAELRRYAPPPVTSELHRRAQRCLESTGRTMAQLHSSVGQLQQLLNDIQHSAAAVRGRD